MSSETPLYKLITYIVSVQLIFQSFDIYDRLFQSKVKAKTSVKSYIISLIITSIFKITLAFMNAPLVYFAIVQVLEFVILALGWTLSYYRTVKQAIVFTFSSRLAVTFLKESWVLMLSSILIILYMRLDQFMINSILNIREVGNFSAAVKLSEAYYLIPTAITGSLLPAIIIGKNISDAEYRKRLQKLFDIVTWLSIFVAIGVTIVAEPLTKALYGHRFEGVGTVLSIHIWSGIFVFWGSVYAKCFVVENMAYFVTFSTAMGLALNFILNFVLIHKFGISGAAFATLTSQFFTTFLSLAIFRKTRYLFVIIIKSLNFHRILKSYVFHARNIS